MMASCRAEGNEHHVACRLDAGNQLGLQSADVLANGHTEDFCAHLPFAGESCRITLESHPDVGDGILNVVSCAEDVLGAGLGFDSR